MKPFILWMITGLAATGTSQACPLIYAPVCADPPGKGPAEIFSNSCVAESEGYIPRPEGAMIQFDIVGEEFWVYTTSASAISDAKGLLTNGGTLVPMMTLADGASCSGSWTFHAVPDSLTFESLTIELCDGRPSYVEANKAEWLSTVKSFCPWAAKVVGVYDLP
ncbi:BP74-related protein [Oligoflexus tunisiensis]|uniref:BP74-related protein n=1 Tax=Oligoflexus tunisiensis TaxID=708132 RepID=UPI00114C96B7|nr:hypothetical protein [Oligoflexus tunisiensis]